MTGFCFRRLCRIVTGMVACLACAAASAQQPGPAAAPHLPGKVEHGPERATAGTRKGLVPALFLSDIHFDPFRDPAKAVQLATIPVERWDGVLGGPASATQEKDFAALQGGCTERGLDTSAELWRSSLQAMHGQAAGASFVTVSGDFLAHGFDCKFKQVFPSGTQKEYVAFVTKTIGYVLHGIRSAVPQTPIYAAMGNNDSGCGDYKDDRDSAFLNEVAKIVADALPAADGASVRRDFANEGFYVAALPAAVPNTRILVLDDLFLSAKRGHCTGKAETAASDVQLGWMRGQMAEARERKQRIWVLGHIPPGVDLYATLRKMGNLCGKTKAQMFLGDEKLGELMAEYSDVIRLAIFGHTHVDEMRLLMRETPSGGLSAKDAGEPTGRAGGGVPLKVVASISPIDGNNPSFTLALIDPGSGGLVDYTVVASSNLTGVDAVWTKEYSFSEVYHQPAFSAPALKRLTEGFRADLGAATEESRAYLRFIYPGTGPLC